MRKLVADSAYIAGRHFTGLRRQPLWLTVSLIEPLSYLLLFGAMFQKVAEVTALGSESYFEFLVPGVAILTALVFGPWSGFGVTDDLESGVFDRFLVTDVRRSALIVARLAQTSALLIAQTLLIAGLAWLAGGELAEAARGIPLLCLAAVLTGTGFGSLMCGLALILRSRITLIAISQFITLPLLFLSTALLSQSLLPQWMVIASSYNPVNWAVTAGREGFATDVDWVHLSSRIAFLSAFAAATVAFALRALRAYQRSI